MEAEREGQRLKDQLEQQQLEVPAAAAEEEWQKTICNKEAERLAQEREAQRLVVECEEAARAARLKRKELEKALREQQEEETRTVQEYVVGRTKKTQPLQP